MQSGWIDGIGCPTDATTFDGTSSSPYTDPACPTGDRRDDSNEGLLLAKTGPTANVASAGVVIRLVRGTLTELGYDLRKPDSSADPRGSHCGAGAPRFNIEARNGTTYFLGCNSPPATTETAGNGWLRLRWGGTTPLMAFNASTGALEDITSVQSAGSRSSSTRARTPGRTTSAWRCWTTSTSTASSSDGARPRVR